VRVLSLTKYPPIQGGVSARSYWIARALAARGHDVHVVTNAPEVEEPFRLWLRDEDLARLEVSFPNGGRVTVRGSGSDEMMTTHVPSSPAYASKLAGLAVEHIRQGGCDVVFSYYLEPFGVSACLASSLTGVPYVVQHAGSDRGRLLKHPELGPLHREVLRGAARIVTPDIGLEALGIPVDRFAGIAGPYLPEGCFGAPVEPLDVDALVEAAVEAGHLAVTNRAPLRRDLPVLGILGKVGDAKGTFDLVAALARLRAGGDEVALLALVGGREWGRFVRAVRDAGLDDLCWTLPLLPHWKVGGFVRACTAVCFLEREFPIAAHRPGVPLEVLASGVPPVLSGEIVAKQRLGIRHGENAFVVRDPRDHDELTRMLREVVSDPDRAEAVGRRGAELVHVIGDDDLGREYERVLTEAIGARGTRRRDPPSAEAAHSLVLRHMPATVALAPEVVALDALRPVLEGATAPARAFRAAGWIVEELERRGDRAAAEVARFERELLWLCLELPRDGGDLARFGRVERAEPSQRFVSLSPQAHVVSFAAGVAEAVAAGARAERPEVRTEGAADTFVFHKSADLVPRVYRVNALTRALLQLCDGSRRVEDVVRDLRAARPDEPGVSEAAVRGEIARLARERVLLLSP
jgi:glycosyltransferase involved in cell wall biosynthesis